MKYGIVYIVINDGEVVYASEEKKLAREYADSQNDAATEEALLELGNDDSSDKDIAEAAFKAGHDGGWHKTERVDISNKLEDEEIELLDGDTIFVSDILEKLENEK